MCISKSQLRGNCIPGGALVGIESSIPLDSQRLKSINFEIIPLSELSIWPGQTSFYCCIESQALEEFVPVMITTATGEKESARRVLEQTASGFISTPSKQKQTVSTIRQDLLYKKLSALLASQGKVLERYSQHVADYPGDRRGVAFQKILTSIEESLSAHERTIYQIETSLKRFIDLGKTVETQAPE